MPTEDQIQIGDLYYYERMKTVFTVVSPNGRTPYTGPSWLMSSGDEGKVRYMHTESSNRKFWRPATKTGPDFEVVVGSLWYSYGHDELFTVVRANESQEAGVDSWVMRGTESCKTLYLHHRSRVHGDWLHVSREPTPEPAPVVRRSRYHRNLVI